MQHAVRAIFQADTAAVKDIFFQWKIQMEFVALGKSDLLVSRTSFGGMSLDCKEIQAFGDAADEKCCAIVHQAYDAGVNFFDVSHSNPTCEKRLGAALHGIRQNVILATKTKAQSLQELRSDLQESLQNLESDCIELYQLEDPLFVPGPETPDGIYNELVALKERGVIKHFGIASEDLDIAREAVESGLYETVQFPFSMIAGEDSNNLVKLCAKNNIGCIAMQPLNGGLVDNIPLAFGFMHKFENVVPVWGAHTQEELQQILYFEEHPPIIDEQFEREIAEKRLLWN